MDKDRSTLTQSVPRNTTERAFQRLRAEGGPLALHEFNLWGVSESALGARLREARRRGEILTRQRKGKPFKEWYLKEWNLDEERGSD